MKTNTIKNAYLTKLLGGLALAAIAQGAMAASNWNSGSLTANCTGAGGLFEFQNPTNTGPATSSAVTNSSNCVSNGSGLTASPGATLTAFSTTSGLTTAGTSFVAAGVAEWSSGFGVLNKWETDATGPHATDNAVGVDALLLSFGSKVSLSQLSVGWTGTDSDMSLLAWTGSGAAPVSVAGLAPGSMTGWTLVGNYSDVLTSAPATVSTNLYSSYWLVSAYSSAYGGGTWTEGNDSFKLSSILGKTCNGVGETQTGNACLTGSRVPEPGSLVLLGLGLVGMYASRKRALAAV